MIVRAPIAVDYTAGPGHAPGVGRYVRELVRALVALEDAESQPLELLEYGRAPRPMEGDPLGLDPRHRHVHRRRVRLPRRVLRAGGLIPPMARRAWGPSRSCRLLHRTAPNWPPLGDVPYSLPLLEFPPAGTAADARLQRACQQARGILVFSHDAARRASERYGVEPARVHLAPVGCDHWVRDAGTDALPQRATRDIVILGGIRRDRHPQAALRAFEALRGRGEAARLLIVGRPGDHASEFHDALQRSPARAAVRWIKDPDESKMPGCVGGGAVLLHLADDEASPVTPLEAARMGLAIVASPIPAFREALEGNATFADFADSSGLADALSDALAGSADPAFRRAQREAARPFTWDRCATAHRSAWELMLS